MRRPSKKYLYSDKNAKATFNSATLSFEFIWAILRARTTGWGALTCKGTKSSFQVIAQQKMRGASEKHETQHGIQYTYLKAIEERKFRTSRPLGVRECVQRVHDRKHRHLLRGSGKSLLRHQTIKINRSEQALEHNYKSSVLSWP